MSVEQLRKQLAYSKKQTSFAWAKYYEATTTQLRLRYHTGLPKLSLISLKAVTSFVRTVSFLSQEEERSLEPSLKLLMTLQDLLLIKVFKRLLF